MHKPQPARWQFIAAFAAVYLIWGSTYLGIHFAVQTLPPFLMAGVRFLIAGVVLFTVARASGAALPTAVNWRSGVFIGAFLLLGGNGFVVLAEQQVPSGLTALLISMTPIWMALMDWARPSGHRPSLPVTVGLTIGFIGVGLLIGPHIFQGGGHIDPLHLLLVPLASLSWAAGSIYARGAKIPVSPLMGTAVEMLGGGALLLIFGVIKGEAGQFHPDKVSGVSIIAFIYLVTFGSLIAYTAYDWILHHASLARTSTYAYVNPVVAVFLGWGLAHESITPLTLVAAAVIVGAVITITTFREQPAPEMIVEEPLAATQVGVAE